METSPVNLGSESESNYIDDRSGPEEKKDLETIQSEENKNSKELDDLSACDAVPKGKDKKESSENPKNMRLLQKSSDAMNQLLDNMSNLKVNSTMETKVPESSEALKPETNTENVKSALNAEDSRAAPTNVTVQEDLSPVRFHRVHGENIKISNDYCTARPDVIEIPIIQNNQSRLGQHKYMVFSSRPIAVDEKVYIRLETVPETFIDYFGFCFTDCDPNTIADLNSCEFYNSLNYFSNNFVKKNYTYYFCVEPSGIVGYGMNDEDMGCLFAKVNINVPLWAAIKLCHNVTSVSFIDSPNENETEELKPLSLEKPSPPTANALADLDKNNQIWGIKEGETKLKPDEEADLEKIVGNEGSGSVALGRGGGVAPLNVTAQDLPPIRFHRVHGEYIKMSNDYSTARPIILENDQALLHQQKCIVFSSRPIAIDEKTDLGKNNQKWDVKEEETKLKADEKADLEKKTVGNEGSGSTAFGGDRGVAPTNVTMQDLPPICFHRIHGENIKMSNDYCTAQPVIPELSEIENDASFSDQQKYMVFSSRPLAINEMVYLRLETVPKSFVDLVSFGFTDYDPNTITDLNFRECFNWLRQFSNNFNNKDIIFSFCVKPSGEVSCFMNDVNMDFLFINININTPVWAVMKLPHNVTTLKIIDSPKANQTEELTLLSEEKPSPPTVNDFIRLIKHLADVSNLNLNSIMDKEKPKSSEALKPITDTEKVKSPLNAEGCGVAPTNVTVQNLPPVRFHRVHGEYIKISNDYCTARADIPEILEIQRDQAFLGQHKCIVFSSRPIAIDEKVYLRLESVPRTFLDLVGFGLTDCDPNTIADLKFWEWYKWLKYFSNSFNSKDNIFHFCVKPSGEVSCFMNDKEMCYLLLNKIDINVPHWAVIKLTHNVNTVQVIDSPKENKTEELKPWSVEKPSPPTTNALTDIYIKNYEFDIKQDQMKLTPVERNDFEKKTVPEYKENDDPKKHFGDISNLKLNSTMDREKPKSSKALQPETNMGNAKRPLEEEGSGIAPTNVRMGDNLLPLRFYRIHENIKIPNEDRAAQTVIINDKSYLAAYDCVLFSSRPVTINENVYLRLETVSKIYWDHFGFGFTDCDPKTIVNLKSCDLYNWLKYFSYSFNDKDLIFQFCVKPSGEVTCFMNDVNMGFLFNKININAPLWAIIKLPHYVTFVNIVDSPKGNETDELNALSIQKPSPPTTNALDQPDKQFDNINNLYLNSTTDREKPAFSIAFKPKTNIENAKRPFEEEDCANSPTDVAMNVITPLRFHRVHGQFIKISNDYCTAQSAIPKDKPFLVTHEGFAFSSRPVAINEKVYLCLEKVSRPYIDPFGFGFTDCDPNVVADLLPRLCRFRSCIFGNCLNYLPNNFGSEGSIFYFFVKPSGEVCYGINNKDMGCLSKVSNVKIPLWGFIKISNDISSVKLMESLEENKSEDLKSLSEQKPLQLYPIKLNTESKENQKTDIILKSTAPSRGISTEKPTVFLSNGTAVSFTSLKNLRDLRFHSVHGKYIKLSPDKTIAQCEMPAMEPYYVAHECYVFSSRPVDINEKVHLKLETVSKKYLNAFSFGFTDCDPCIIPNIMNRLCQSSPCILGNYLIALSNQYCVKDNYMHFYVNTLGEIHFGINEEEKGVCYQGVNTSSRVWAVIKVTNCVSSVKLERKKQDSFKSFFAGEVSSVKASSTAKKEEIEASSKNTKSDGDDERKNSPANCNMLTGKLRTEVTTNTKGQTLFDWGVESTVKTEPEFIETELKIAQTSEEAFKSTILPSTSAKQIQPPSSTDVENNQESADYDVKHFAKIVDYQLHRIPEHRRMKCMQKILEVLDTASTVSK